MIALSAPVLAALQSRAVAEAWLVSLHFEAGPIRLTTWETDLQTVGSTDPLDDGSIEAALIPWTALGSTLGIGQVKSSEDAGPDAVTLSLPLQSGMLAATLGSVESYRGRRARIWLQIIDAETLQPIGAPVRMYTGEMQPVKVDRSGGSAGPVTGRIEMQLTRAGMSSIRRQDGLRLTHEQHRLRYPGDMGLQYLGDLVRSDTTWLSVAFQRSWSGA